MSHSSIFTPQPQLQLLIVPLSDCVCRQLRLSLAEVLRVVGNVRLGTKDVSLVVGDAELLMFLNALERLMLLSLAIKSTSSATEEDETDPAQESSGFLGYVSNVFITDSGHGQEDGTSVSHSAAV